MQQSCWQVLGIEPTGDEALIRARYAAKLKQTNPEDNPDGFKVLRSAYETALQEARWRAAYASDSDDDDARYDDEDSEDRPDGTARIEARVAPVPFAPLPEPAPAHSAPLAHASLEPEPFDGIPAAEAPAPPDELIAAHRAACLALQSALAAHANPWALMAAFDLVIKSPAMQRIEVYTDTESWLIELLHQERPASALLLDPAITFFGWNDSDFLHARDGGASIIDLRTSIALEQDTASFLARLRDRRHEFHAAYQETATRRHERGFFTRLASLPRLRLVRRFLDYVDQKMPYAHHWLDADAVAWWHARRRRFAAPAMLGRWAVWGAFIALCIALYAALAPRTAPDGTSKTQPVLLQGFVRQLCIDAAIAPPPREAANAASHCQSALRNTPQSLLLKSYYGVNLARQKDYAGAMARFDDVLAISPLDPFALYGRGLMRLRALGSVEQSLGAQDLGDALALDPTIGALFASFGLAPGAVYTPSAAPPAFPFRPIPAHDQPRGPANPVGQSVFDEAYAYFNVTPAAGNVLLECLARSSGVFEQCRIVSESPARLGLGEVAIRIAANARFTPALLNGAPIDNVPESLRLSFILSDTPPK